MGRRTGSSTLHSTQSKLGEKTVLDIGAGSRIVGLSTLLSLTSKVDFKEVGPFATESIRLNLKVNNLSHNFQSL